MKWEEPFAIDITDNIQHIYTAHTTQHQNTNNTIKKLVKELNRDFTQREIAACQQSQEKMLNIANYQGNATQNKDKMSPHTCQNGYH